MPTPSFDWELFRNLSWNNRDSIKVSTRGIAKKDIDPTVEEGAITEDIQLGKYEFKLNCVKSLLKIDHQPILWLSFFQGRWQKVIVTSLMNHKLSGINQDPR